jgi:excisionase family DNA binding protein
VHNFLGCVATRSTFGNVAEYLDLETVAEILGVRRYTAYVLVRTGDLRAMKIPVIGWRVERADVSRYRAGQ